MEILYECGIEPPGSISLGASRTRKFCVSEEWVFVAGGWQEDQGAALGTAHRGKVSIVTFAQIVHSVMQQQTYFPQPTFWLPSPVYL